MKVHHGMAIPPEGETVELKESVGEWKEIVTTCAAFATAQGGRIYVGVANDGRVLGVQIGKGTMEDLANKIAQNTNPKVVPSISTIGQGTTILTLDVPENPIKPVYAFDKPLRRSGRTNQVLSPTEAAELYFATRGVTWDETTLPEASIHDIDAGKVQNFLRRAQNERQLAVGVDVPIDHALRQMNLIRDGKMTVAAILLFGKDPEWLMVQSSLRCARFKGDNTVHFLDMKVIEGTIIDQVEEAMAFVKRHISMEAEIKDLEREERWEYPLDAVREAITNAVCHRNYADTGNVQVRIFDHGLEVWNPGGLPAGLTVEDLRRNHESRPRNKLIARVFFLIRYIEQFGTGTGRMIEECRKAGIPEPQFESHADSFLVRFEKPVSLAERVAVLKLNERQLKGMQYAEQYGQMTRQKYETVTGASTATAKRDLSALVKSGVLRPCGRGRSIRYELSAQIVSRKTSRKHDEKKGKIVQTSRNMHRK